MNLVKRWGRSVASPFSSLSSVTASTIKMENLSTVSGEMTLVAAVHYFYMRDVWVSTGETPTVYRYIDWLITVLMVEFFLILSAIAVPARVSGNCSLVQRQC